MDLSGKRIHFMGIGGIGVSALAEMAARAGAVVSGCDRAFGALTERLEAKGIRVAIGHDSSHADGVDLLVYTSAVPASHPERVAAGERQERRGAFLARFLDARRSCGVCGTHGKTTTSWLLAHILICAGLDPAVYVGGIVPQLPDGNFRLGEGPFVSELDESDGTFLLPRLSVGVITNIDSDHLRHYHDDASLDRAFLRFAENMSGSGLLVVGVDSPRARRVFEAHGKRKTSFGFDGSAMVRAADVRSRADATEFDLVRGNESLCRVSLPMHGRHNVLNALAAIAVALEWEVPVAAIREALSGVCGVERRMEFLGRFRGACLYSDYAHHPAEMAAAIQGIRERHGGKILVVFQPHLFSRTRDYADDFARGIAQADSALVVDIYPAREEPIPGVDSGMVVEKAVRFNPEVRGPVALRDVERAVMEMPDDFEAIVFMGAGDIDAVARRFVVSAGGRASE